MGKRIALAVVIAVCAAGSTAYALYDVADTGMWPKSWPAELEPLRKQSRTLEGPVALNRHYAIPFTKQAEFEAAWPHIVKVKSKGAPLFLKRGPNFFLNGNHKAGVVVHCPPLSENDSGSNATSLELVVDGEIIDLNRISLPADTPIIDNRFHDETAGGNRGSR